MTIVPPSALAKAEIKGAKSDGLIFADFYQNICFHAPFAYIPMLKKDYKKKILDSQ